MSIPGLLDTAAPVAGAAGPAKHGAAQKHAASGDFAALMQEAEAEPAAGSAENAGPSADSGTQPDSSGQPDRSATKPVASAETAEAASDAVPGAVALNVTNLAGFFKSMKAQASEPNGSASSPASPAPEADDAKPDGADPSVVTDIVVVADVAVTRQARPDVDIAISTGAAPSEQGAEAAELSVAAEATTPAIAATRTPTPSAVATGADAAIAPEPVPAAPALTPAAIAIAAATSTSPQLQMELQIAAAAASANAPGAVDALNAPAAQMTSQAREILETLSAVLSPSAEPATVVPSPVFERARAVSLAVNGTDRVAGVPKIKIPIGMGDVVSLRAERMSVTPRAISPLVVVPHSATVLAGAGAVTAEVTATTLAEAHVTDQIVQSLKLQWMKGGGEARIELNPNGLGKVQVQVRVEHGAVTASVQAETAVVREFVASRRDELVQNLSQQGLRLDKLVVAETPKEQPTRDGARDPRQAHREPARHRRDDRGAETDTFELNTPQENV